MLKISEQDRDNIVNFYAGLQLGEVESLNRNSINAFLRKLEKIEEVVVDKKEKKQNV